MEPERTWGEKPGAELPQEKKPPRASTSSTCALEFAGMPRCHGLSCVPGLSPLPCRGEIRAQRDGRRVIGRPPIKLLPNAIRSRRVHASRGQAESFTPPAPRRGQARAERDDSRPTPEMANPRNQPTARGPRSEWMHGWGPERRAGYDNWPMHSSVVGACDDLHTLRVLSPRRPVMRRMFLPHRRTSRTGPPPGGPSTLLACEHPCGD